MRGIVGRLGELLDREIGGGEIGVAEAEIDDVVAGAPKLERQVANHREDVRRQVVDAAKVHCVSLDEALALHAGEAGASPLRGWPRDAVGATRMGRPPASVR